MRNLRFPLKAQLTVLVLFTTLLALAIVAIATWVTQRSFTLDIRSTRLSLTASLKAAQVASQLELLGSSVESFATRVRLQRALINYNSGVNATDDWKGSFRDMYSALQSGSSSTVNAVEVIAHPLNPILGRQYGTIVSHGSDYNYEDPTTTALVPQLVYAEEGNISTTVSYNQRTLDPTSTILLGPQQVNGTGFLSITMGVSNNNDTSQFLGYVTVVMSSHGVTDVLNSPVGLDNTGVALLVGSSQMDNRLPRGFLYDQLPSANPQVIRATEAHYLFPPEENYRTKRHEAYSQGRSFTMSSYPAIITAFSQNHHSPNNGGSILAARNEAGNKVSVGYALPPTTIVDWVLLLEQSQSEVYAPLSRLRKILLGCIFGTAAAMGLLIIPLASVAVRPIEKLRDATLRTVSLSRNNSNFSSEEKLGYHPSSFEGSDEKPGNKFRAILVKAMFWRRSSAPALPGSKPKRKIFRLPKKVNAGLELIKDELTDLLENFNKMTEELHENWGRLEERVASRTEELEISKKAAEAANESKSLFIANVSHELKTPLAGILGMCALCSQEANDPLKTKYSMDIALKSGELLNHLLNDLLQFSKSSGKHQIELDEREFRFREIKSQLRSIFDQQAKQRQIRFKIDYEEDDPNIGPFSDMTLMGDQQRLLQICINLISNSLKFTPKDGVVRLRIRCLPYPYLHVDASKKRNSSSSLKAAGKTVRIAPLSRTKSSSDRVPTASAGLEVRPGRGRNRTPSQASNQSVHSPVRETTELPRTLFFEFQVEDTGPGIEPKLQESIFLPFVQGDLRLTKKYGGTGLGLSICRQLATLMQGSIDLESHVNVGSKFTLRVPLKLVETRRASVASSFTDWQRMPSRNASSSHTTTAQDVYMSPTTTLAPEAEAINSPSSQRLVGLSSPYFSNRTPPLASPSDDSGKGRRLRVLVAEDNFVNQEVVLRMLRLEDIFDVKIAKNGQEALEAVQESMAAGTPFNLILMDVQMPVMDGRESTQRIRSIGYEAPIIALSAFSDETNQEACIASGMNNFLPKPIKRPALKKLLRTYCTTINEETNEEDPLASKGAAIGVAEVEIASEERHGRGQIREESPGGSKEV